MRIHKCPQSAVSIKSSGHAVKSNEHARTLRSPPRPPRTHAAASPLRALKRMDANASAQCGGMHAPWGRVHLHHLRLLAQAILATRPACVVFAIQQRGGITLHSREQHTQKGTQEDKTKGASRVAVCGGCAGAWWLHAQSWQLGGGLFRVFEEHVNQSH